LHAQTTQEINGLASIETRPAAWLSAKGRVRALVDVVPADESFWLVTDADNVDWFTEQLRRFVLRSKVDLVVVGDWAVYSLAGEYAPWLESEGIELEPGCVAARGETKWFSSGAGCASVIAPSLPPILSDLPCAKMDSAQLAEIASGRPAVTTACRENYIPQMLNLDWLGAISFTKGCYPGQEIVARTHNLGEVKRRLKRFALAGPKPPRPGDAIVAAGADSRSVGEVNRVAAAENGFELLAVVRLDAAAGKLSIEGDRQNLEPLPLPYEEGPAADR
jgi:folate-binding protein YgfZ